MIKEDYCSCDIARLIKEKGLVFAEHTSYIPKHNADGTSELITTITHQTAMKWLREKYNIFISVGFGADDKGDFLYMADIYDLTNDAIHGRYVPIIEADEYLTENPKSYEDAVNAAIKYCLENLI